MHQLLQGGIHNATVTCKEDNLLIDNIDEKRIVLLLLWFLIHLKPQ